MATSALVAALWTSSRLDRPVLRAQSASLTVGPFVTRATISSVKKSQDRGICRWRGLINGPDALIRTSCDLGLLALTIIQHFSCRETRTA
jgi:hypothetical protein